MPFTPFITDQNGSTTTPLPARVSEGIHGHFGSEGASEFLGRPESEAETYEELRASIRTCNWYVLFAQCGA